MALVCGFRPSVFDCLSLIRQARFASSKAWTQRAKKDYYGKKAKAENFPSRAVYKIAELNQRFKLFKPGMTVIDLGWAPGSWSKYAAQKTRPNGRVIGVDLLCIRPPEGVTAIQGNFLSTSVQQRLEEVLQDDNDGRSIPTPEQAQLLEEPFDEQRELSEEEEMVLVSSESFLQRERELIQANSAKLTANSLDHSAKLNANSMAASKSNANTDGTKRKPTVDIVISDMCGITRIHDGFWLNTINLPYLRLQNTSGILTRDHAASMDVCDAALLFACRNLKPKGVFLCKFYAGEEDSLLEARLRKVFRQVYRVKPESSRKESREQYFVAVGFREHLAHLAFAQETETE